MLNEMLGKLMGMGGQTPGGAVGAMGAQMGGGGSPGALAGALGAQAGGPMAGMGPMEEMLKKLQANPQLMQALMGQMGGQGQQQPPMMPPSMPMMGGQGMRAPMQPYLAQGGGQPRQIVNRGY